MRDVPRLVILAHGSVFVGTPAVCEGFTGYIMPQSSQFNDKVIGAMKALTFLPLGILAGGERRGWPKVRSMIDQRSKETSDREDPGVPGERGVNHFVGFPWNTWNTWNT